MLLERLHAQVCKCKVPRSWSAQRARAMTTQRQGPAPPPAPLHSQLLMLNRTSKKRKKLPAVRVSPEICRNQHGTGGDVGVRCATPRPDRAQATRTRMLLRRSPNRGLHMQIQQSRATHTSNSGRVRPPKPRRRQTPHGHRPHGHSIQKTRGHAHKVENHREQRGLN